MPLTTTPAVKPVGPAKSDRPATPAERPLAPGRATQSALARPSRRAIVIAVAVAGLTILAGAIAIALRIGGG